MDDENNVPMKDLKKKMVEEKRQKLIQDRPRSQVRETDL